MTAWLRRNRWGLLLLPVMLVALGVPYAEDLYGRYVLNVPRKPLEVALGQAVRFDDTAVTMLELSRVTAIDNDTNEPVWLPPGFSFWRARLHFSSQPGSDRRPSSGLDSGLGSGLDVNTPGLGGCKIMLEDGQGRLFHAGPSLLSATDLYDSTGCTPGLDEGLTFAGSAYFLLPPRAEPVAVRIILESMLPTYVRLLPS